MDQFQFNVFGRDVKPSDATKAAKELEAGPSGLGARPRTQLLDLNIDDPLQVSFWIFLSFAVFMMLRH